MSQPTRPSRRKRARRGAVIAVLTASTIFGTSEAVLAQANPSAPAGTTTAAGAQRFFIRIAAGTSLTDALAQFTTQTGVRIVRGNVDLSGLTTVGVTGSLTAADALKALLANSGVSAAFTSANSAALAKQAAASAAGGAMLLPAVQVQGQTIAPGGDPYADPAAPYKADRLSSSKFTEPILDTARSVTVLTAQALDDKNATSLREIGRSTAGVTLGSGEGGNAFGDRFFIRGFDARNDVFVDGVRDPGVSVRENFNADQVEILRGPGSSYAGRGTTGGAINIATKQAGPTDFFNAELTHGFNDQTNRATIDVNKALTPTVFLRVNGLIQGANVAGRDFTTDNRNGIAAALTVKPSDHFTVNADFSHTNIFGLPDFGVPYNPNARLPVTENDVARNTYYGIVNRDFTKAIQDTATLNAVYNVTESLTLENKFRQESSLLAYIGTIPENPSAATPATAPFSSNVGFFSGYTQLNAQSRNQTTYVLSDQPQATFKFNTGSIKHTIIGGAELSSEKISIDTYTGFTSELTTGPVAFTSAGAPIVSVYNPTHYLYGAGAIRLAGNPLKYGVDTAAVYLIETANINEKLIVNAGLRFDDYNIKTSNNTSARAADFGITSYNAGIVYKPSPAGSIYASFATAAQPVGAELDATSSTYGGFSATQPTTQIFGPQLSRAYEVGTKWELFDRHMLATLAVFQNNVYNARETAPAGIPGYTSGAIYAGAAYRSQGVDIELAGNITEKWSVMGGLVLMDPKVLQSLNPINVGLQLANIAPQSFNALTKYELTPRFELGGQAIYTSRILGGSLITANGGVAYPNPPNPTVLPQHWRFDAFAEQKLGAHTELKLYVSNIFNKTYYDALYQSAVPFIQIAPGRNVSLIGTVKF